jgi:hypothetical protein
MGKTRKLSDQVRIRVKTSGMSRYRISRLARITEASLSRFMARKTGMSTDNLDKLAALLGLRLAEPENKQES